MSQGSPLAIQGPRCTLRSQRVLSDASVDYARMTALNIPGALIALAIVYAVDSLSGFGITTAIELPEPYGGLILWLIVLPALYGLSSNFTALLLQNPLILKV